MKGRGLSLSSNDMNPDSQSGRFTSVTCIPGAQGETLERPLSEQHKERPMWTLITIAFWLGFAFVGNHYAMKQTAAPERINHG